jgi:hypothetical protein
LVITKRNHPYYDEDQSGTDAKTDSALLAFGDDLGIFLRGGLFSMG